MGYWTRRKALHGAGVSLIGALAGCSVLADSENDPEKTFLVSVNNYTESRYEGTILIENDGTEVVRQYLEIPAAEPDGWATVETEITVGAMSDDTPLDVEASFGDMQATGQHTLGCSDEYKGDVIYVQIEPEVDGPNLRLNLACYDEFPSSEADQGGINQS